MHKQMMTILHGESELIDALNNPEVWDDHHMSKWQVASDFIAEIRAEIELSGKYPYNDTIANLTAQRLNIPITSFLGTLVYNTQGWVSDKKKSDAGWEIITQEMIDTAYANKQKIEVMQEGYLFTTKNLYNVRKIGSKCYAMKPHARNWALTIQPDIYAKIYQE